MLFQTLSGYLKCRSPRSGYVELQTYAALLYSVLRGRPAFASLLSVGSRTLTESSETAVTAETSEAAESSV